MIWYKVVQIWPGLFVCKQVTVCPSHIWTTMYMLYDMIWYDIWYDICYIYDIRYDMVWYDMWYYMWYDVWYDMIWYGMIWQNLLPEVGFPPGGSGTQVGRNNYIHEEKQYIKQYRNTEHTKWETKHTKEKNHKTNIKTYKTSNNNQKTLLDSNPYTNYKIINQW